ncbi:cupin domain-containing protein [Embleya sp. NPDC020630]|uniref:cupin domain-containing protein n=1 Tax=Embleya sp. NPDC020630 TaxID=3363979 RepID=UPI0037A87B3E
MESIDIVGMAAALATPWSSHSVGKVGTARVNVLRMDGDPVREEAHEGDEMLLVLDGRLELLVEGAEVTVGAGGMYRVPAGARHAVRPGSCGTLVILEESGV